jgi:hypothetical protein
MRPLIHSHERTRGRKELGTLKPLVLKERKIMDKNLLKELTVEQLKTLENQVKQEISRRTIAIVDKE